MTICIRRWLIALPNGPTSEGVCRDCGEVRKDFSNVFQYKSWPGYDRSSSAGPMNMTSIKPRGKSMNSQSKWQRRAPH